MTERLVRYITLGVHPVAKLLKDKEQKQIDIYFDALWQEYIDVYCAFMFGAM